MLCDSTESHPAHIDLHRLFTVRQTLNISATVKRVARGGGGWNAEGRSKETGKKRVNKGSGVNMKRQLRQTPDWAHVDGNVEGERRGKQEGCCNRTHVLPGDSYPQGKLWSSLQHVCVYVCARVCAPQQVASVWTITQFIYDGSPLTVTDTENNLLTTLSFSVPPP